MRNSIKIALTVIGSCLAAAIAVAAWFIYPGTPGEATSLRFQGYVLLPSAGVLSVLDYMTLQGDRLFVTAESTGNVYRIRVARGSLPTRADVARLDGEPAAHGVAVDPTTGMAFVSRSETNTVDAFDPDKMIIIKRIPVADDPDAIFYDGFDKLVYAASGDSHRATLIDPSTQSPVGTIDFPGKPEYAALDPSNKLLYQNLRDTNTVVAVDLARKRVVDSWPLPGCEGPTAMALDEGHRRLFIGCKVNSLLAVFDLQSHRVTATVPIGKGPDSVAFDPELHRIYTTGKSGVLVVIRQEEPAQYRVLDVIHLHYGAHTLALDPVTHALYVGYAGLVVRPRIAVFAPRT